MESFRKLLTYMGIYDVERIDFIKQLPVEISTAILSMLDAKSICFAAQVSHTWKILCGTVKKKQPTTRYMCTRLSVTWKKIILKKYWKQKKHQSSSIVYVPRYFSQSFDFHFHDMRKMQVQTNGFIRI